MTGHIPCGGRDKYKLKLPVYWTWSYFKIFQQLGGHDQLKTFYTWIYGKKHICKTFKFNTDWVGNVKLLQMNEK